MILIFSFLYILRGRGKKVPRVTKLFVVFHVTKIGRHGESKVSQLENGSATHIPSAGDVNVLWLDVEMNHFGLVKELESREDLLTNLHKVLF